MTPVILMYHGVVDRVDDPELDGWAITVEELRRHLHALTASREVVPLGTVVEALRAGGPLDPRWAVLTFDDGYRGLFDHGWPVLREFGVPWSVFVPVGLVATGRTEPGIWSALCYLRTSRAEVTLAFNGSTITQQLGSREDRILLRRACARTPGMPEAVVQAFGDDAEALLRGYPSLQLMSWDDLGALARAGVDVGAHGWLHRPLDRSITRDELREEIERPRGELGRRGHACRHFCAPYGVWSPEARDLARAAGYEAVVTADATPVAARGDPFALPRLRADIPWSELALTLA